MNAALHLARGAWLAPCDDDDELTPDHVEVLLRHAKEHQLEMVWSKALFQRPDGSWDTIGSTPLSEGEVSHGSVLYSLGLRFFQHNATSWQIPEPGDWNLWRRMSAAGVRTGFLDHITYRHYCDEATQEPSRSGTSLTGRRLHLGCGPNRFPGWSNIDVEAAYEPDVLHDLSHGIPAADGSCDLVYSEHVFEHFPLETGMMLMRESLRALRPGGVLRIAMPDLAHVVHKYSTSWRDQAWLDTPGLEHVDSACRMLNVGLREWGHTYVYDEEDLRMRLRQSGFTDIRRCELGRSDVPDLRGLETRADSLLILEAVAP
jgi:predicted SAM-dependent methyltransferase